MSLIIILFLISLICNVIMLYSLHNSHCNEEPIKFPLILWILFGILTLIPFVNCVATVIYIIILMTCYLEDNIEFNDDFWLAKKY